MLKFFFGFLSGLLLREFAAYLPTIARWQINRGVKQLPEEKRAEVREQWHAVEGKISGNLTKVLWGIWCNYVLAPESLKPLTPERIAKTVHFFLFFVYLKIVIRGAFKGQFAYPKTIMMRWRFL